MLDQPHSTEFPWHIPWQLFAGLGRDCRAIPPLPEIQCKIRRGASFEQKELEPQGLAVSVTPVQARRNECGRTKSNDEMFPVCYVPQHTIRSRLKTVVHVFLIDDVAELFPGTWTQFITKLEGLWGLHGLEVVQTGIKTVRTSHTCTLASKAEPRMALMRS